MLDALQLPMNYPLVERRDKLATLIHGQQLDGMLISCPVNVRYLTGFTGDSTYLLLSRNFSLLISDGRFTQQLEEECPGLSAYIRPAGQNLSQATIEQLKSTGWNHVGCEARHLTLAEFELIRSYLPTISWKALGDAVEQLRMIKDEAEILAIQRAIQVAEQAFIRFKPFVRPGESELTWHHRMEMLLRDGGAEEGSFPAIVALGHRASLPHAPPTKQILDKQEMLLVDWGARVNGYVSDLTRTCPLRNNTTARLKPIYDAVFAAHQAAVAALKPGATGSSIDRAARAAIEARGFPPYSHGLGHGIGLDVHEAPQMRLGVDVLLQPGMVVTVEPAVYLPEWGGVRLEDDYLITPGGAQRLSTLPQDDTAMTISW
ncbi:MAG TPA: Xaa-Pro peptidase family protein [Gemmatales bacterium]|nr:Xaa-Pro peptidase family protein [Gemmatales bacterium]HMP15830.1 Xaa-Pro peptidase family protein [Gemmatales bacterium]